MFCGSAARSFGMIKIVPVILSGGAGTRLWPLSTPEKPKQFHALVGKKSMFAETLERVGSTRDIDFDRPIVVGNQAHIEVTNQAVRDANCKQPVYILEPVARNTAPAIAAAALFQAEIDPAALMLVLPADHLVSKPGELHNACLRAEACAKAGLIVTFGIVPNSPETGYGYIKLGGTLGQDVNTVDAFAEKPDLATATAYLRDGGYAWNAGIFFFQAAAMIEALEQHAPLVLNAAREALALSEREGAIVSLNKSGFEKSPAISIDFAVMEKTNNAAAVSVEMGWNDVGSFSTLWEISPKDALANVTEGPIALFDTTNALVRSSGVPIAVIGLHDIMVIATETGILIAPRHRAQDIGLAAKAFKIVPPEK
jgi:mannose-1-phosphate guanylyltransferase / mannose-6-phosphate isomerase